MDIFLVILGFLFILLGLIGSFLPVLPGPITSWFGLFLLHATSIIGMNWSFLGVTLCIAIFIWFIDYFIPAYGTKRFGGSKYGIYGTTIGLFIGLLSPIPFGMLIGAFLGAFIGELLFDTKDSNRALKASIGAFIGFLASATIKFIVSSIYLVFFIKLFWQHKNSFY